MIVGKRALNASQDEIYFACFIRRGKCQSRIDPLREKGDVVDWLQDPD